MVAIQGEDMNFDVDKTLAAVGLGTVAMIAIVLVFAMVFAIFKPSRTNVIYVPYAVPTSGPVIIFHPPCPQLP
jgi:hypothetical protein